MHHSDFLTMIASIIKPNVYVELGLYVGETISKILPHVGHAYGVDIKNNDSLRELETNPKITINYTGSSSFFDNFPHKIDMAFIDADHCCASAMKDFDNVYKRLNDNGIIFMHDTDPISDFYITPGYCGDSYKLVPIYEQRSDINIITLPLTEAGLSMIMKKNSSRTYLRHLNN